MKQSKPDLDLAATLPTPTLGGEVLAVSGAELGVGVRFGAYSLLELLGEGGMGRVYRAEQHEPVHRQVAIKLLRSHVPSVASLARFEVERQALARMNHPAIAQVFDAGTTADGWPWFAMELVGGEPITEFAASHALELKARVALMVRVCRGVHHAHQKGMVHRDLKPSNILVTEVDGLPLPKIIDFGIATASGDSGRAQRSRVVGTPSYMSPEQADDQASADVRSDVFALGMVLYELIAGRNPRAGIIWEGLSREDLKQQLLRVTPPPSQYARGRNGGAELDAITLKALAPSLSARYQSVTELADELLRWLEQRPVQAMPDRVAYRLRKWVQRHTLAVSLLVLMLLVALSSSVAVTRALLDTRNAWAETKAREAEAEQVVEFQQRLIEELDTHRFATDLADSLDSVLRERLAQPELAEQLADVVTRAELAEITRSLLGRQLLGRARGLIEQDYQHQAEISARLMHGVARAYRSLGLPASALETASFARTTLAAELPLDDPRLLSLRITLAALLVDNGQAEAGLQELDELTQRIQSMELDDDNLAHFIAHHRGRTLIELGRHQEALAILDGLLQTPQLDEQSRNRGELLRVIALARLARFEESLQAAEAHYQIVVASEGPDSANSIESLHNLAVARAQSRDHEGALTSLQQLLEIRRERMGLDHPSTLEALNNVAVTLLRMNQPESALGLLEELVESRRRVFGSRHPATLSAQNNLASGYMQLQQWPRAEALLSVTLEARLEQQGLEHQGTLSTMQNLADCRWKMGKAADAVPLAEQLLNTRRLVLPEGHVHIEDARRLRAWILSSAGDHAQAVPELRANLAMYRLRDAERPPEQVSDGLFDTLAALAESLHALNRTEETAELAREPEVLALFDSASAWAHNPEYDSYRQRLEAVLQADE